MITPSSSSFNLHFDRTVQRLDLFPADPAPAGEDFVAAVRRLVQHLVELDVEIGGEKTSILGMHFLSRVRHLLQRGHYYRKIERDLWAAMAELAELTGWLLIDANEHAAAERVNKEALRLAQAAGDRHMELFVTYNRSLQATFLKQPQKALTLARPYLDEDGLTPRLTALFKEREARSYAQMGLRHDALKTMGQTASLLYEGVSNRDPEWSWWINERGLLQAEGAFLGGLGDWEAALDPMYRALDMAPNREDLRDRFRFLCVILRAHLEIGAWQEAQQTAEHLSSLIGVVGSPRPLIGLTVAIARIRRPRKLPSTLDDTLEQIRISAEAHRNAMS